MRLAAREPHRSGPGPRPTAAARSRQAAAVTAVAALAMLLTAACGGARPTAASVATPEPALPAPPSSPATSPPVTDVTGPTGPAVLAYRAFWDDAVYANAHAGYWNAAERASLGVGGTLFTLFSRHASDGAFEQQRLAIYRADRSGEFTKGELKLHPFVRSASPPTAPTQVRLFDCVDATTWLVHTRSTGALTDNQPGLKHALQATVVRTPAGWRVRDLVTPPGAARC